MFGAALQVGDGNCRSVAPDQRLGGNSFLDLIDDLTLEGNILLRAAPLMCDKACFHDLRW